DPSYWHALTRKTFRIPDQPLLQGHRWQSLYKKLLTQTRLYAWGNNKSGNLGVWAEVPEVASDSPPHPVPRRHSGWPRRPRMKVDVGVISDVQCG
ncbi:MAG: hypothetical protein Q9163_006492, partial [Psora crenata]